MRAYALYGYLHTGQWHNFWSLLASPNQSILAVHYLPFFLLPHALAGFASYVALQNLTTFLMLAYAVFSISDVVGRKEWAPIALLLCAVNNVALSDFYSFFLDMQFLALGLLTLALQMKAWQSRDILFRVLSGFGLGALFFLKPANALIFFATCACSEVFHVGWLMFQSGGLQSRKIILELCKGWLFTLLVVVPIFCLALLCGGIETILQLIDHNEVNVDAAPVPSDPLLRLLYFPLCLSAYYNVSLLIILLVLAAVFDRYVVPSFKSDVPSSFPLHLGVPIILSYLILGEAFSFGMQSKPLRGLILMVPLLWFFLFWLWERRGYRVHLLGLMALTYALLLFGQKAFNIFGSRAPFIEPSYQLTASSWCQFPTAWHHELSYYDVLYNRIQQKLPPAGIICTNSIITRSLLVWQLQNEDFLQGRPPRYEIRNLLNYKGAYFYRALEGANVIVLIMASPDLSRFARFESAGILGYADRAWCDKDHKPRLLGTLASDNSPVGFEFLLDQPLTLSQVDQANNSASFISMSKTELNNWDDYVYGHHYSSQEGWQLLKMWYQKKFH